MASRGSSGAEGCVLPSCIGVPGAPGACDGSKASPRLPGRPEPGLTPLTLPDGAEDGGRRRGGLAAALALVQPELDVLLELAQLLLELAVLVLEGLDLPRHDPGLVLDAPEAHHQFGGVLRGGRHQGSGRGARRVPRAVARARSVCEGGRTACGAVYCCGPAVDAARPAPRRGRRWPGKGRCAGPRQNWVRDRGNAGDRPPPPLRAETRCRCSRDGQARYAPAPRSSTITARRFCDQQEMSLHTATGRSLPYDTVRIRLPVMPRVAR